MANYTFPQGGYQLNVDPDEVRPEDLQVGLPTVDGGTPKMDFQRPPPPAGVPSSVIPPPGPGVAAPPIASDPVAPDPALAPPPPPGVAPAQAGAGPGGGAEAQLRGDLARVQSDQERDARAKGSLGVERAGLEGQVAQAQVEAAKAAAARQAALEQATDAEIAKRQGVVDAEDKKFKSMGVRDFWADKTTGARVLAAIAMGMGAAGASLRGGGPNYAMEIIDKAIDRDYQRQRDAILQQKEVVAAARGGVDAARQSKADKLVSLENWRKNAYEMAGAQAKVTLSKMGIPEAEAEKNALLTDVRGKALESKLALDKGIAQLANTRADTTLKYAESARQRAESQKAATEKPLTESQGKSADLAGRMIQDNKTLEEHGAMSQEGLTRLRQLEATEGALANNPKTRAALVASGKLKTPEQLLNDRDRLIYGARKRFAASVLRGDSGAAIGLKEYLDFDQQNFEQIGDKGPDGEAKRAARQQQIKGKLISAGHGAAQVTTGAPAPSQPPRRRETRRLKSGQVVSGTVLPDGSFEVDG